VSRKWKKWRKERAAPQASPETPSGAAAGEDSPQARPPAPEGAAGGSEAADSSASSAEVNVSGWKESGARPVRRDFPHAGSVDEPVRIAMTAEASAEMVAHAKESLDAEVCGVLAGQLCEDEQGKWVWAKAAIRGASTRRGGSHVTYTQETWQQIHEAMDRDYPKLRIVGWYHSHPGFGVAFSEMDRFIQRNFFAGEGQFALVMDPVSGEEAVCVNGPEGIEHVGRFWVDGRPRNCRLPVADGEPAQSDRGGDLGLMVRRIETLEERLQQTLAAIDEERTSRHHVRLFVGMLATAGILAWIVVTVLGYAFPKHRPPENVTWTKVPVVWEGKPALLGVQVVSWELPMAMHESYMAEIIEKLLEQQKADAEAEAEKRKKDVPPKQDGPPRQGGSPAAPAK
jgi:proteasome lid subunit RPN8/RPN11